MLSVPLSLEKSFDAFARFLRLDDYPNQPEIVEWPMTEFERVEQATMQALSCMEVERAALANAHLTIKSETGHLEPVAAAVQEFLQQQPFQLHGELTIHIVIQR